MVLLRVLGPSAFLRRIARDWFRGLNYPENTIILFNILAALWLSNPNVHSLALSTLRSATITDQWEGVGTLLFWLLGICHYIVKRATDDPLPRQLFCLISAVLWLIVFGLTVAADISSLTTVTTLSLVINSVAGIARLARDPIRIETKG